MYVCVWGGGLRHKGKRPIHTGSCQSFCATNSEFANIHGLSEWGILLGKLNSGWISGHTSVELIGLHTKCTYQVFLLPFGFTETVHCVFVKRKVIVCQVLRFYRKSSMMLTSCLLVNSYQRCEELQRLYLQCQALFLDSLAPLMMAVISFETLVTIYQSTRCNAQKDLNI